MVELTKYQNRINDAFKQPLDYESENPRSEFLSALSAAGFAPPKVLRDGILDRIDSPSDKKGEKSGWYIFNQYDKIAVGVYGSWKGDPPKATWTSKSAHSMTFKERMELNKAVEAADKKRKQEEQIRHEETAAKAFKQWNEADDADGSNPYLKRKKVKAYDGVKAHEETLIVPVTVNDTLASLQYIPPVGKKKFMFGGRTQGCYFKIKGKDESIIYIAEGYATGATACEATGHSVYVAFSAGNLYEVVSQVKNKYTESKVVILGENNDTFRIKATQILEGLGIESIYPPDAQDDFNDVHCDFDLSAVTEYLKGSAKPYIKAETQAPAIIANDTDFKLGGVLQEMVDYYNATSGNKQPLFAVQAAIATCSTILARNFSTNLSNRTSLFLLNIAKSGTGKEHAKKVTEKILEATDNAHLISGDGYTSGAAVISALQERPRHVTIIDEFSKYLQAAQNKNGSSHLMEANAMLMQVISRLDGTVRARSYATIGLTKDKKKEMANQYVINPAVTLMAMSTPDDLFKTIDVSSIKDGFLNRFIICVSDAQRTMREHKEPIDVPQSIIEWDAKIKERIGEDIDTPMEEPKPVIIPFSLDSMANQKVFDQYCIDMANDLDIFGMAEIPNRSNEMAMRLALIIALSKNPKAELVTAEDVDAAIGWVKYNLDKLVKRLKMSVSSSEHEANKKEILSALRNIGEAGITWSMMQKRAPFSRHKQKDLREILVSLKDGNLAMDEPHQTGGKGRPTTLWKAID